MIWFEPWCPENLLRTESGEYMVRVGDQIFEILKISIFHVWMKLVNVLGMKFHEISSLARISLPRGAAVRIPSGLWRRFLYCAENRTSNIFPGGGSKSNFGRREKNECCDTFWFITLVLPDGLR